MLKKYRTIWFGSLGILVFAAFCWGLWRNQSDKQQNETSEINQDKLHDQYVALLTRLVPRLWPDMDWSPGEICEEDSFEIDEFSFGIPCFIPFAARNERVWTALGVQHDVLYLQNSELNKKLDKLKAKDEPPTLTVPEVVERAKHYLELMEQEIPPEYVVTDVFYGTDEEGHKPDQPVWHVAWQPCIDGIFFDDVTFGKWGGDYWIMLKFHEEHGLVRFRRQVGIYSYPDSMEVKIPASQAAEKAISLAPTVFQTGIFNTMHANPERRHVRRMSDIRLVMYSPNWMLDPNRSHFNRPLLEELNKGFQPPEDTRLCWRAEFEADEEPGPDGTTSTFPEKKIWIFIDARSGECVGANFL